MKGSTSLNKLPETCSTAATVAGASEDTASASEDTASASENTASASEDTASALSEKTNFGRVHTLPLRYKQFCEFYRKLSKLNDCQSIHWV